MSQQKHFEETGTFPVTTEEVTLITQLVSMFASILQGFGWKRKQIDINAAFKQAQERHDIEIAALKTQVDTLISIIKSQ